jgi:hypothetical protein
VLLAEGDRRPGAQFGIAVAIETALQPHRTVKGFPTGVDVVSISGGVFWIVTFKVEV